MKNARLEKVVSLLEFNDLICDIGTDHGYLAIIALDKGLKVIEVTDNKIGPLNNAKANLKDSNISFRLADGLDNLNSQVNCVTICGMGGELIKSMLETHLERATELKLVLQPNNNIRLLRKWLNDNFFEIIDEEAVFDLDKYYEILVSRYNPDKIVYNELELYFGPILIKKRPTEMVSHYQELLNHYLNIKESNQTKELDEDIELIKDFLEK